MSRHDKDYNSSVKLSAYADLMLDRIDTCISDKISKSVTRLASAIVTKVNSDGSVNIRLPSEDNTEFTKIQNQCPYELKIGDAVELTLKNGSFNNCWVSAKHGMGTRATSEGSSGAYVLPVATATQLGGIKVGAGLVISKGVLSVTGGGTADAVEWENVLNAPTKVSAFENDAGYLTSHQSLKDYATKSWVQNQGYLTQHQDISGLATKLELQTVEDKIPTIPTKVSAFENDAGYLTQHQSLANYALKSELPKNVSDLTNDVKYITASGAPVQSVNGKTGAVVLNATDVQALPNTTVIPTTTSQLTNNSGYITSAGAPVQSVNGKIGTVSLNANDVGALPSTTTIPVVNNAKLTIQKNGVAVDSFTANASVDKIINIEVPTKASDIEAISTDNISQTLGNSETKVPSEKAVAQAMSAAGYGDMLKANYATKSDSIVDKSYADENGDNIASTYLPKFKLLNNTDANSLITSQICVIGAGNTNLPDEATGSVLFVAGDGTNAFQIIVVYATNTLNHRAYKDGAWTIWRNTEAKTSTDSATNFDAYGLGFITEE